MMSTTRRVDDYRSLTDVGLRRRREPEQGLFMAESHQVIARAVVAGYPVRSVLTTPRWQSALQDLFDDDAVGAGLRDTPVFVAEPDIVAQITGYRVHRGALAAMTRLPLPAARRRSPRRVAHRDPRRHRRPHQCRGCLPLGRRTGVRRRTGGPHVRRPALSAVGAGLDGCGVLAAMDTTGSVADVSHGAG